MKRLERMLKDSRVMSQMPCGYELDDESGRKQEDDTSWKERKQRRERRRASCTNWRKEREGKRVSQLISVAQGIRILFRKEIYSLHREKGMSRGKP